MTMARVRGGEVVEVGIPDRLSDKTRDELHHDGWRPVQGTTKPDNPPDGLRYVYGEPYVYDTTEDMVYGTWVEQDIPSMTLTIKREKASLSRADFKLALREMGELDTVKAAMNDPATPERAKILFDEALHFDRLNEDFLSMAAALGYTDSVMDQLFGITT